MRIKPDLKLKVGKLSFTEVAQKSGVTSLTTKKFRDDAFSALRKAGYGSSDAKSILSGSKKMEHGSLKRVFNQLNKAKVIKKSASSVTNFVKEEKAKKERIIRFHLRERADEILREKKAEAEAKKSNQQKAAPKKSNPSAPLITSEGFGPTTAPTPNQQSTPFSSLPKPEQLGQEWATPSQTNIKKDQQPVEDRQPPPVPAIEKPEEPEDMVID